MTSHSDELVILIRVLAGVVLGGLIGFERTFRGRPAGFRTHALVCVSSSLLMLVTVYQHQWMIDVPVEAIRTDPTRMAQGIMTGIGFLGAGVIFKEGLTVSGLTTAASIWITAVIGIMVGVGFYFAAVLGTIATVAILSLFRIVEQYMPTQLYAHHTLTFARGAVMDEDTLRRLIAEHGFSIAHLSYRVSDGGKLFEYAMVLRSTDRRSAGALSRRLSQLPDVLEFHIDPIGG